MSEQLSEKAQAALKERDRLRRRYVAAKKLAFDELCRSDPHGTELRRFTQQLETLTRPEDAPDFLAAVSAAAKWLCVASLECRAAALDCANQRIVAIRTKGGLSPFDDPLPESEDDMFQTCRRMILL